MRVLLDENLDWRLVRYFDADFQVTTVSQRGWKGMRNGELLGQAAATFDALITMDKGIEHQQNLRKYTIGIVLIIMTEMTLTNLQIPTEIYDDAQALYNTGISYYKARKYREAILHLEKAVDLFIIYEGDSGKVISMCYRCTSNSKIYHSCLKL